MKDAKDLEPEAIQGFLKRLEGAFISLKKTARDLAFYPKAHPALKKSLDYTVEQLNSLLKEDLPLTVAVAKAGFFHRGQAIGPGNTRLGEFATELYFKQVETLHFLKPMSSGEIEGFLRLLLLDAKQLREVGGIKQALFQHGIENPVVEEVEFRLADSPKPSGELAPQETVEEAASPAVEPKGAKDSGGGKEEAFELTHGFEASTEAPPLPLEEPGEGLAELLERLERAESPVQYQNASEKLEVFAQKAKSVKDRGSLTKILSTLVLHVHPLSSKPPLIQEMGRVAVERITDAKSLDLLIDGICEEKAPDDELVYLLANLGGKATPSLIGRLRVERDLQARKRLMELLILQGPSAIPSLRQALDDPSWHMVKTIAFMLGQIGGEDAIDPLARHLHHEDRRARWEVIRALGRVGGLRASDLLLRALEDQDPVARQYAIAALGALREQRAVPILVGIASSRSLFFRNQDLQKAAIAALGQIGGPEALRALVGLSRRRGWIWTSRKAHEEIKMAAKAALEVLRGGETSETLGEKTDG